MEDNNNTSPYYKRPESSANLQNTAAGKANMFAMAAKVLGIIAIFSVFTFSLYPAFIMGGLAIILAVISKGDKIQMCQAAKTGFVTGIVALALNVTLIGGLGLLFFTDNPVKTLLNDTSVEMYGQTFDDMIKDAMDGQFDLEYKNLPYNL